MTLPTQNVIAEPQQLVKMTYREGMRQAIREAILRDERCFSISFNLDLMPSGIMGLAFQASDAEKVLRFFTSLHNSQVDDSIEVAFQLLVK